MSCHVRRRKDPSPPQTLNDPLGTTQEQYLNASLPAKKGASEDNTHEFAGNPRQISCQGEAAEWERERTSDRERAREREVQIRGRERELAERMQAREREFERESALEHERDRETVRDNDRSRILQQYGSQTGQPVLLPVARDREEYWRHSGTIAAGIQLSPNPYQTMPSSQRSVSPKPNNSHDGNLRSHLSIVVLAVVKDVLRCKAATGVHKGTLQARTAQVAAAQLDTDRRFQELRIQIESLPGRDEDVLQQAHNLSLALQQCDSECQLWCKRASEVSSPI